MSPSPLVIRVGHAIINVNHITDLPAVLDALLERSLIVAQNSQEPITQMEQVMVTANTFGFTSLSDLTRALKDHGAASLAKEVASLNKKRRVAAHPAVADDVAARVERFLEHASDNDTPFIDSWDHWLAPFYVPTPPPLRLRLQDLVPVRAGLPPPPLDAPPAIPMLDASGVQPNSQGIRPWDSSNDPWSHAFPCTSILAPEVFLGDAWANFRSGIRTQSSSVPQAKDIFEDIEATSPDAVPLTLGDTGVRSSSAPSMTPSLPGDAPLASPLFMGSKWHWSFILAHGNRFLR